MFYTDPPPSGHCLHTDQKYFSPATDDRQGDTGPAGSLRLQLSHNQVARALLPLSNWASGIRDLGSGIWDLGSIQEGCRAKTATERETKSGCGGNHRNYRLCKQVPL